MAEPASRLLVPLPVLVGLVAVTGVAFWLWNRAAQPPPAPGTVATGPSGPIAVGEVRRTGTPAALAVGAPESRGSCTWLLRAPELEAVSDKGLSDHAGFFDASPVLVFEDGTALTPHSRGGSCDGAFAHAPLGLFVRPASGDVDGHAYTARLTGEVRAERRRGPAGPQPVFYVVPGTTLHVPIDAAWSPGWGAPVVSLAAVASQSDTPAVLAFGGATVDVPGDGGGVRVTLDAEAPVAPSEITLTVPDDGPVLVVHDLVIGDGDTATAVIGSLAGVRTPPSAGAGAKAASSGPAVSRVGRPERLPATLEDGEVGLCRYVLKLPAYEDVSDLRLYQRYGYTSASPLVVYEDGRALTAHDRGEGCTGAFAHPPTALVVRPSSIPVESHDYAWSFDAAPTVTVKARGGKDETLSWVTPGTSLVWTWDDPLRAGAHEVVPDLVVFAGTSPAVLTVGDAEVTLAPGSGEQRPAVLGPETVGPWRLAIASPEDGPVVLVRAFESRPLGGELEAPVAAATPPADAAPPGVPLSELPGALPLTLGGKEGWVPFLPADGALEAVTLADGRDGIEVRVPTPGAAARACSPFVPATADVTAEAELQVAALTKGDKAWQTVQVEDGWLDAKGEHVQVGGTVHATRHLLDGPGDLAVRTWVFPRPPGGEQVRFCVRFAQATGTVRIGGWRIVP
ncbi:MAG: hypothetical protein H6733_01945 [Alphaproteobacteria bacterium]|nr:hypothetical protein [Alphaproteobacteria bacterium]